VPTAARYARTMAFVRGIVGAFRAVKAWPSLLKAGIMSGLAAGLAVGAMVDPPSVGLLFGGTIGAAVGAIAGMAMAREDTRVTNRTRELDAMIGITDGSMGAPPGSIPPGDLKRDPDDALELERWATAWLTPPPPAVR
jgi:hypothetical protein